MRTPATPGPADAACGDVAVTGVGLVTGYGFGVDRFWRGLLTNDTALGPARRFDHAEDAWVGEVPVPSDAAATRQAYADAAVREALRDAGYPTLPDGCLVVTVGQTGALTDAARATGADLVAAGVPAGTRIAFGGPHVLTHACASAAFGVAFARELLAAGAAPAALVVGATTLNREEYASMRAVRAVSPHRARPFDRHRDGISLGEGGGAVVLEPAARAAARGARTDVRVSGAVCRVAGATRHAAASDHEVLADCVDAALGEADVSGLDYVHAHATGTSQGDAAELAVLDEVADRLGATALPVSSHKGATGHLLHASAFPALAAAVRALRTATLPPTPGLADPEPAERLRLLRAPLTLPAVRTALLTSAGFGGNNAVLVLTGAAGGRGQG